MQDDKKFYQMMENALKNGVTEQILMDAFNVATSNSLYCDGAKLLIEKIASDKNHKLNGTAKQLQKIICEAKPTFYEMESIEQTRLQDNNFDSQLYPKLEPEPESELQTPQETQLSPNLQQSFFQSPKKNDFMPSAPPFKDELPPQHHEQEKIWQLNSRMGPSIFLIV